jgi:predicted alpha-1,2-mannosidase
MKIASLAFAKSSFLFLILCVTNYCIAQYTSYVDPMIGSEGEGNVFVGPTMPFGMIKPGPDCAYQSNSGYTPLSKDSSFFGISHTHVSGTGGGPKYGNILLCPTHQPDTNQKLVHKRDYENVSLGYFELSLNKNQYQIATTCSHSVAMHKIKFMNDSHQQWLMFDLGHYLGKSTEDTGEGQKLLGSEIEIVNEREIRGYSRVKGGWNRGEAYTVFFYAQFNRDITNKVLLRDRKIILGTSTIADMNSEAKAFLKFGNNEKELLVKLSISFISTGKARENLIHEVNHWDFDKLRTSLVQAWESLFQSLKAESKNPELLRQFYTSIYHNCLIPSNRTGENPNWKSKAPYYDDFYAIWDTYRTTFPLLLLMDKKRTADIINSLIDTYRNTGWMPDARSGNSNGLTQGGTNSDIVVADAYVKNLTGIDYHQAYQAMLKNGESDPGAFDRLVGRGGLSEYLQLGYVSYNYSRSCTRTVEYSLCDQAISTLAFGLGDSINGKKYLRRSTHWKNLWRDTTIAGLRGFIWPKNDKGTWLDSTMQVKFSNITWKFEKNKYLFTPESFGWGWDDVFYEGNSQHYSLHLYHDLKSLIEKSGGVNAFENRLDYFFEKGIYDVTNEPCFFAPLLYYFINKPYKSTLLVKNIIAKNYNASKKGLPGNDDSGATSSWFTFNSLGLYPNAGHDYYLITAPLLDQVTFTQTIKPFTIKAINHTAKNIFIDKVVLNGKPYPHSWIKHSNIEAGGLMEVHFAAKPSNWGNTPMPE